MKFFLFLLLLLAGGFAFWKYQDQLPSFSNQKTEDGVVIHTVVKGDTLHALSKKYNTSVSNIKQRNGLTNNIIHINDKLHIKPGEAVNSAPSPVVAQRTPEPTPKAAPPKPKAAKPTKPVVKKELPKSTVMETSSIAIDIDDRNQVYLKNRDGKFAPAGSIIYGSDADANGMEVKTITFRDLKGKETTLPNSADPQEVIRLALKKQ
ncbi:LysM peptidoglycan-binding domain-containing protein [Rubritalea spongiae]|uniref:LysM peptidoglycan-binding domain-containing protein n=1 Tax=Rubritalea spongiae TaxID=430797 RepID=A0ABW5DZY8_9BACT